MPGIFDPNIFDPNIFDTGPIAVAPTQSEIAAMRRRMQEQPETLFPRDVLEALRDYLELKVKSRVD